jgi:peroxiredoxin
MIKVGEIAPDFNLKDQNGKTVKLSSFKGKKVLLSFRPLAWTPVCHDQMRALDEAYKKFEKQNAVAFGIGVDSQFSNKAWADSMSLKNTRLLADFWPHGEVSRAYGLFREQDGFSERANVVLDENQKVVFVKVYPLAELPDVDEVINFIGG